MSYPVSRAQPPPGFPARRGREAAGPRRLPRNVVYLEWESEFLPWLTGKSTYAVRDGQRFALAGPWRPGQHMALIGKTREGKSTLAVGLMQQRKYCLALDPKGEDETLEAAGFERVAGLPPRKKLPKEIQRDLDDGKPVRLTVGVSTRTRDADLANRQLMEDALEYARQSGHWTVYVDEYQILADQRMYRLGPNVERMLISAARDETSVITAFQAPAWVPKASTRQATIIVVWRTRDRRMLQVVAEAAGRDWRQLGEIIDELPKYHVLVIPDDLRAPMMITSAPKIS
jgi:hypothetical protein